jgi:hypothetical protein
MHKNTFLRAASYELRASSLFAATKSSRLAAHNSWLKKLAEQCKHGIQNRIRNRNGDKKEFRGVFHERAIIFLTGLVFCITHAKLVVVCKKV